MQLICPHCGKPVLSDNINIQRMAAVCPNCHSVFQFDPADTNTRIRHRKIKQPEQLQLTSDETDGQLKLAFRTNFRLDKSVDFLASAGLSILFTFMLLLTLGKYTISGSREAALVSLMFGTLTVFLYYSLALVAYNKTHIEISDEQIKVSRQPLPTLSGTNTVSLAGIERVYYEETPVSKKEAYDTPRYNVWAEVVDGNRRLIVGDLIEDYAVFVSQRLNEQLDQAVAPDVSNLLDDEWDGEAENGQAPGEVIAKANSSHS
ncbi:MAG TPA: hypothetical protein VHL11_21410 [Phototrophicaceae bacterium]|nr:hypothetical protein [Phototrophicaceae bacterium]